MTFCCIYLIVLPCRFKIIYMHYKHSAIEQITVPTLLLTVFKDIILFGIGIIDYFITYTALCQSIHRILATGCQLNQVTPATEISLIGTITDRDIAFGCIITLIHQIPIVHAEIVCLVCNIIDIGQTKTMRELMTHCTDAIQHLTIILFIRFIQNKFAATCISVTFDTIDGNASTLSRQLPFMWPYRIFIGTVRFRITGIYTINELYFAITIVITQRKIKVCICLSYSFFDHMSWSFIIATGIVGTIIRHHIVQSHNICHKEIGSELTIRLSYEVVTG